MFSVLRAALGPLAAVFLLVSLGGLSLSPVQAQDDGGERRARHPETGQLGFLGFDPRSARELAPPEAVQAMSSADLAMTALATYGGEFGLSNPGQELRLQRPPEEGRGGSVRYQQMHRGVPVLAGELLVNLDESGRLRAIIGELSPGLDLAVSPQVPVADARDLARKVVARVHGIDQESLVASEGELWVFDERLLRPSQRPPRLAWRFEVTLDRLGPFRHLVLVDAQRGGILLEFNQTDMAKNRSVYDNNNNDSLGLPGGGPYRTEGGPASGISEVNYAYDYSGDTYDFYLDHHGRDSIDDAGMELISTTRFCHPSFTCPYANAFWNGAQMVYGDGFAGADDVVAHELTHGVTEHESNLFYYYQSGAINESLSDIWGEFVDLENGAGNDTAGVRWLVGEDLPIGAIRSMSNPPAYGDPDRMSSSSYWETADDFGGVHSNSGINNKAAYLMTDGGSFNGHTISALGIDKVAAIYYEVQLDLLTSGADYLNLYEALYQGCLNQIGGPEGITEGDCDEVRQATEAVEMDEQPSPGFNTDAAFCPAGGDPIYTYREDFESGTGAWTTGAIAGSNRWVSPPTYGDYSTSGVVSFYADDFPAAITDTFLSMSSGVTIPPGGYLHFAHSYAFDAVGGLYDGGVLEFSSNGGPWTDAAALLQENGYDGTLQSGSTNPLAGRQAFAHDSHGYISTRATLDPLSGSSVQFRWRMGLDDAFYVWGWWVDDVSIYWCADEALHLPLIVR